ncbi:wd g-beta repeat-containing protein [Cyclospora cayetanensis]|uniref:Wd g-beta repeat-containing protein n=1 Tax=Cyclospora cayetanensis TaxID=88456 RepID=A0A1D3CRF5_9EIME|nr:wd g-beta repeat-containing protein [Cyclospora cayetanensis]
MCLGFYGAGNKRFNGFSARQEGPKGDAGIDLEPADASASSIPKRPHLVPSDTTPLNTYLEVLREEGGPLCSESEFAITALPSAFVAAPQRYRLQRKAFSSNLHVYRHVYRSVYRCVYVCLLVCMCIVAFSGGDSASTSALEPHLFLACSAHPTKENEVYLLLYEEETLEASLVLSFPAPSPAAAVAPLCLKQTDADVADISLLVASNNPAPSVSLWRATAPLQQHADINKGSSNLRTPGVDTLQPARPFGLLHRLLRPKEGREGGEKGILSMALGLLQQAQMACEAAAWDPHDSNIVGFARASLILEVLTAHSRSRYPSLLRTGGSSGGLLALWDLREQPHEAGVLGCSSLGESTFGCVRVSTDPHGPLAAPISLCFNPSLPFSFVSGGTDGAVRTWDIRSLQAPVKTLRDVQAHWVAHTQLNPFHDQLLLTAGTDGCLKLHRVEHALAGPSQSVCLPEEKQAAPESTNGRLLCVDETSNDSLCSVQWSAADAWIFAALCVDGCAAFHQIPTAEKYHILL